MPIGNTAGMSALKWLAGVVVLAAFLFVLLATPAAWPYLVSAILIGFAVAEWGSSRTISVVALGAAAVVIVAAIVLAPDEHRKGRDTGIGINAGNQEIVEEAEYVAYLRMRGSRDATVEETLSLAGGTRRSFTAALREAGWRSKRLRDGEHVYVRSKSVRLNVSTCPPCFPAEKTNELAVPQIDNLELPSLRTLTVVLTKGTRLILEGPSNAFGDTFPEGKTVPGPGETTRVQLPLPERAAAWEFEVRSKPFRWDALERAADLTVGKALGSLLGIISGLILKAIAGAIMGMFKRRLG